MAFLSGHDRGTDDVTWARTGCASLAGCEGIVCSGFEVEAATNDVPNLLRIVPGIRLSRDNTDQRRIITPKRALQLGATHLVVGRPIMQAEDPQKAAQEILENMQDA